MSKVAISEEYLTDIADSIREKLDTQDTYKVSEMSEAIDSISGGGGIDWSAIGYSEEPEYIQESYNYAVQIKNNWDATQTSLRNKFQNDNNLVFLPLIDTSKATDMQFTFESCYSLIKIPLIDTSKVTTFYRTFRYCYALRDIPALDTSSATNFSGTFTNCFSISDESLDNILQMCIGATLYTGTKTLAYMGVNSTSYPASKIQSLPSYQDFINAGWTIGY